MTTANTITYGSLAFALLILALNIRGWWQSGKKPGDAAPFLFYGALGMLATVCGGGVLGWAAGMFAGGTNSAAENALTGTTGTGAGYITPGNLGELDAGGALVVFVASGVAIVAWSMAGKTVRRRMLSGLACGVLFGLTAGVAGLLGDALVPGVNSLGAPVIAWFNGGGQA